MRKRLADIQERLKPEHKDLAKLVDHAFTALEKVEEEHRLLVAANALAGVRPAGEEEQVFYHQLSVAKDVLISVLEKTTEDFEHAGDKNWHKNFQDGVER